MTNPFTTRHAAIQDQTGVLNMDIIDYINKELSIGFKDLECSVKLEDGDYLTLLFWGDGVLMAKIYYAAGQERTCAPLEDEVLFGNITTANLITILNFLNDKKNE